MNRMRNTTHHIPNVFNYCAANHNFFYFYYVFIKDYRYVTFHDLVRSLQKYSEFEYLLSWVRMQYFLMTSSIVVVTTFVYPIVMRYETDTFLGLYLLSITCFLTMPSPYEHIEKFSIFALPVYSFCLDIVSKRIMFYRLISIESERTRHMCTCVCEIQVHSLFHNSHYEGTVIRHDRDQGHDCTCPFETVKFKHRQTIET